MANLPAGRDLASVPGERLGPISQGFLLALIICALSLPGLWQMPTLDRDEARFAQATKQMLETGDALRIRFQDKERNRKPHGIHWLQAISVRVLSADQPTNIWAYRVPSVLGLALAVFGVWALGGHLADRETGWRAALLFGAGPVAMAEATIAKTDAMLTGLVVIMMLALAKCVIPRAPPIHRRRGDLFWVLTFWLALTAAILIKGPIAPMIAALTVIGLVGWRRIIGAGEKALPPRALQPTLKKTLKPGLGCALMIVLLGPWAMATHRATQGRFFTDALGGDFLGKVAQVQELHGGPPGYHLALLPLLFWPVAGVLPWLIHRVITARGSPGFWQPSPPILFLCAWLIPAWIVFEGTSTKLPHYTLPLYPALALLAAMALRTAPGAASPRWVRGLGIILLAGICVGVGAAFILLPLRFSDASPGPTAYGAALLIVALSGLAAHANWRHQLIRMAGITAFTSWFACTMLLTTTLPGLDRLALSQKLAQALGGYPAEAIFLLGYEEPSAVFLLGTQISFAPDAVTLITDLGPTDPAIAIVAFPEAPAVERAAKDAGLHLTRVANIDGFNYSIGTPTNLVIYRRDGDIAVPRPSTRN